jgi:hypothetical protein
MIIGGIHSEVRDEVALDRGRNKVTTGSGVQLTGTNSIVAIAPSPSLSPPVGNVYFCNEIYEGGTLGPS